MISNIIDIKLMGDFFWTLLWLLEEELAAVVLTGVCGPTIGNSFANTVHKDSYWDIPIKISIKACSVSKIISDVAPPPAAAEDDDGFVLEAS